MNIPFITSSVYEGKYPINFYFQREGWLGRPALVGTPGLLEWSDLEKGAEVRGTHKLNASTAYAVCGNTVYRLDTSGTKSVCTGTLGTSSGIVQMAAGSVVTSTDSDLTGLASVMITDGVKGYYVNGTTLTEITDSDFPTPGSCAYQDGWFIVAAVGSGTVFSSEYLDDPSSWNPLDVDDVRASPDNIVSVFMDHRELLFFGEDSIEPYQNIGADNFPFVLVPGAYIETGLAARESVAKLDNSVFWLAEDFTIKKLNNYVPVVVSPEALGRKISGYSTKSDAISYSFKDGGNAFYVITLPSEDVTWVLNTATISQQLPRGAWHQWASGTQQNRHRSNCHMFFAGKNLVGDFSNGKIYEISNSTYTDDGVTIRRTRVTPPLFDPNNRGRITYPRLEIEFKAGTGLITGQGSDPQAMLRYSDDGCRTWSNRKWEGIGKIGKYKDRAIWRRLASSRLRNYELSVSDPVEWVILGAHSPVTVSR